MSLNVEHCTGRKAEVRRRKIFGTFYRIYPQSINPEPCSPCQVHFPFSLTLNLVLHLCSLVLRVVSDQSPSTVRRRHAVPDEMFPRSLPDCSVVRDAESSPKGAMVARFSEAVNRFLSTCEGVYERFEPHTARVSLGARGEVFDVNVWHLPSGDDGRAGRGPLALCMHGHGHCCSVASWAAFFPSLIRAGYSVVTIDAPGFGQSSGAAGQANLWRTRDAFLVIRLLEAFGCGPRRPATIFAQCMGGAMFLRAFSQRCGRWCCCSICARCNNFMMLWVPM